MKRNPGKKYRMLSAAGMLSRERRGRGSNKLLVDLSGFPEKGGRLWWAERVAVLPGKTKKTHQKRVFKE